MNPINTNNNLIYQSFTKINLKDPFFDSLKKDYCEFDAWFKKKQTSNDYAYIYYDNSFINAFLYLKNEDHLDDINFFSPLVESLTKGITQILKIGTLKINAHGTRLGERFIKKIFDHATTRQYEYCYVTVFDKHSSLIDLLSRYGFRKVGYKDSVNGRESVLLKSFIHNYNSYLENYPRFLISYKSYWLLAIDPIFHSRLFPDSILRTESKNILQDVSHTNSIHKIYLSSNPRVLQASSGDVIIIYRNNNGESGHAEFKSVVTSICIVEEIKLLTDFTSQEDFVAYCSSYSIFEKEELINFWKLKKYPFLIKFTYNIALPKRIIRAILADDIGINRNERWSFLKLSYPQLIQIFNKGEVNASFIINKATICR